ncbi:MAG: DNA mismatch repair protein MutS [bacterium]
MKLCEVDKTKLSPMMRQYVEIKENYKDELLFFRLGDFYELFFEDAITTSREVELTLTGKNAGLEEKVPMCGVPHHSAKGYIEKLVNKGYKVAIGEQLDTIGENKVVERKVLSVVSKATIADFEMLDSGSEVYIASILTFADMHLLTYLDISTGNLSAIKINLDEEKLKNEILNLNIKEIIFIDNLDAELIDTLKNKYKIDVIYSKEVSGKSPEFLENIDARIALGVKHLFYYLENKLLKNLDHVNKVEEKNKLDYLELDIHSVRNLEIVETLRLKEREYSLLWLLDKTKTAPGSRKLKTWILNPIKNMKELNSRYDKIEKLNTEFILKTELRNNLYEVYDLERLVGKVINGSLNARDLLQIKKSLKVLPDIEKIIKDLKFKYNFEVHEELYKLLESSISEEPPISIKEGSIIKEGYSFKLDEIKQIRSGGKDFIINFEKEIKEETGIKNLKVGYNKIFGYYIEVSKGSVKEVKDEYNFERKQTLANCERYTSPLLKEKESIILGAEEKIVSLEYELFCEIKEKVKEECVKLRETASVLSEIDVLAALAECADVYKLVRPKLNDQKVINIIDGRHPVVEVVSKNEYVPNDCFMDPNSSTLLLTGPNMSGKSTYMRQLAIIVIMAQIGSFVPAKAAELSVIDKIFTRIGASDDLVSGESTFMVEMKEAKNAIINATENSLILFDELGRGTATYDGMSLAKAILEYVSKNIKCFTLFSTHYHELTNIDKDLKNVKNIHVSAVEDGDSITFLHKIKSGPVDKSYGIHVAVLANMPSELIKRASEILFCYENQSVKPKKTTTNIQLAMSFDEKKEETNKINDILKKIDVLNITPMEAINQIFILKELLEKDEKEKQ